MFVIKLRNLRNSPIVQFDFYAEDLGPGYGLIARAEMKQPVFEEFVERLEADVREG